MDRKARILYIGNYLSENDKYPTTIRTLSNLFVKEGFTLIIKSSKRNKILRLLDMLYAIIKHRNEVDYVLIDTYSTQNFYYAFMCSQLARIFGLAYIPILHGGNLPNRLDRSPKMSKAIFKHSFKNIAVSNYLYEAFSKRMYSVETIPNNLEIQRYDWKERNYFEPKLLYVRAFAGIYNPCLALDVLHELKKDYPNAQLCMVGPDKDGTRVLFEKKMQEMQLHDSVEITGSLSKETWHKKSEGYDFFINTTNVDNTPVSVMEAMALGLCVVSTNVGGLPYLIKDTITGVLVPPKNAPEMAKAIKSLINNSEYAAQVCAKARNEVTQFDWEVLKVKWNKLLK